MVETKSLAAAARRNGLETEELLFFDSVEMALAGVDTEIDVVYSSCALAYTAAPQKVLKTLLAVPTKAWVFTRTPLNESDADLCCVQFSRLEDNGKGHSSTSNGSKEVSCPVTILSMSRFEKTLADTGNILLRFKEEDDIYITKTGEHSLYGYVLSAR